MIFEMVQVKDPGGPPASLGHFSFLLGRPRKNQPLQVTLGYDEQLLVTVVARDPDTGQEAKQDFAGAGHQETALDSEQSELLQRVRLSE